jgi:uncharacterized membrane protein
MQIVQSSILIKAPVDKIFSYWNDPKNLPDLWPSIVEVRDIQTLENGGTRFNFTLKAAGISLKSTSEDIEFVENEYVVSENRGGIDGTMTVRFESEGGAVKVNIHSEYTVPIPVLGKLAEAAVLKQNQKEIEIVLSNLKDKIES